MRAKWVVLGLAAVAAVTFLATRVASKPTEATSPTRVVDSIVPIEVAVARFRETIAEPAPTSFVGGASTRDALVAAFLGALEAKDLSALNQLLISRAEFAYLYFPSSIYMNPPYRQDPALVWFMMTNTSERGLNRVFTRDGGRPLGIKGYRCPEEPLTQGENRIWRDCVLLATRDNAPIERKLFGAIIERAGRYKFLTYASEY